MVRYDLLVGNFGKLTTQQRMLVACYEANNQKQNQNDQMYRNEVHRKKKSDNRMEAERVQKFHFYGIVNQCNLYRNSPQTQITLKQIRMISLICDSRFAQSECFRKWNRTQYDYALTNTHTHTQSPKQTDF